MSPRRRIEPGSDDEFVFVAPVAKHRWRNAIRHARGLPGLSIVASLLVTAAIVVSSLMLWSHESDHRAEVRNADVLGSVGQFMTQYTSLDPFHANDYADRILSHATGDFAKEFKDKQNQILIQVARAEPTKGTVVDAGIEKWHDDGSVSVLVATKISTTVGNPKKQVESGNRWVVTAVKEGQQWKISQLTQVI
ncbi:MAG: mammalian cell entry protein [Mycobacteriaceae bacterium]|nr:mammalian cell entry protein [Mycobacteriaceae bacterium]